MTANNRGQVSWVSLYRVAERKPASANLSAWRRRKTGEWNTDIMRDVDRTLRLGTRASPLAVTQSDMVAAALRAAHDWPATRIDLVKLVTRGDRQLATPLAEIGGKGLFTEELEAGLLSGDLDFAVHSLKDLPTEDPAGLVLGAILPRAAANDVLIPRPGLMLSGLADLPPAARIGTASLRRRAQLLAARPDLVIAPLRGNIGTRLNKLHTEGLDATLLAAAGLARMQQAPAGAVVLPVAAMVPAAGQGALAVQCRRDDEIMRAHLAALHCADTADCVTAERAFLNRLDGSCRTPIAAFAELDGDTLHLTGRVLADDGADSRTGTLDGPRDQAAALGRTLADSLRAEAPHLAG